MEGTVKSSWEKRKAVPKAQNREAASEVCSTEWMNEWKSTLGLVGPVHQVNLSPLPVLQPFFLLQKGPVSRSRGLSFPKRLCLFSSLVCFCLCVSLSPPLCASLCLCVCLSPLSLFLPVSWGDSWWTLLSPQFPAGAPGGRSFVLPLEEGSGSQGCWDVQAGLLALSQAN